MDIFNVLMLLGGLAFFLYGMNVMSQGLEKLAGGRLEQILRGMTSSPVKGLMLGVGVTAVIQSSSAVTVMLVGLVNSGIMQLEQTVGVIMGANIGTTVTAWLLSMIGIQSDSLVMQLLKPENFSLLFAIVGILLIMLAKKPKKKDVGAICIGFAVLMYGMEMMSGAVSPLKDIPAFADLLTAFRNPLLGVLAGAVLTGIIQSSSASVGILQALSLTGSISYGVAIPIIMGQNIGTCVTALISSIGVSRSARKVGMIHIAFNLIGTTVFLSLFCAANAIWQFSFVDTAIDPLGIAICHSIFNIVTTTLLLPFNKLLVRLADRMVKTEPATASTELLDQRVLDVPSLALAECSNLTVKMASAADQAVKSAISLFSDFREETVAAILAGEDSIDFYEDRLGKYLTQISGKGLSEHDSREKAKMQHAIGDLERLGDHAVNLIASAREKHDKAMQFSPQAAAELQVLTEALTEILNITYSAYIKDSAKLAALVEPLEQVIDRLIRQIRDNHIQRLNAGECTIELGFLLSDVLNNYERISDHCSNIAIAIIEVEQGEINSHEYLKNIKGGDNPAFSVQYEEFLEKYALV